MLGTFVAIGIVIAEIPASQSVSPAVVNVEPA